MSQKNDEGMYVVKSRSTISQWLHGKSYSQLNHQPPPAFRHADVLKQGYLLKQGSRLKMWTRRYFILRLEERHMTLGYYTNKNDLTLCSEIPIGSRHTLHPSANHKLRFELCSQLKLVLEAESQKEYDEWQKVLQEAITWNHTLVPAGGGTFMPYGKHEAEEKEKERKKKEMDEKKKKNATSNQTSSNPANGKSNQSKVAKYLPCSRPNYQSFSCSNATFEIPTKFKYEKTIGSGAYGVVISVSVEGNEQVDNNDKDNENQESQLAIKNIQRAFDDLTDAKRIVREIKLMRHLQHKHVLGVLDLLPPSSVSNFEDVYIVSPLMATDLHRVIYSRHALSEDHVTFFMYQMLCALLYIHSAEVIHRDLKPSNILLNGNCQLKICDFGLARGLHTTSSTSTNNVEDNENDPKDVEELELTEYVVTRWYRAPEIMLGCMKYTKAVDVWSLGCIFAEMITRKPLFPGQDYIDQLHLILNVLGAPSDSELYFLTNLRARKFMNAEFHKRGGQATKPLDSFFNNSTTKISADALDLMKKMLMIDPNKRISVQDALAHPYFKHIRAVEDETKADQVFDFVFERSAHLSKSDLQSLIYEEIVHFHPECAKDQPPLPVIPISTSSSSAIENRNSNNTESQEAGEIAKEKQQE